MQKIFIFPNFEKKQVKSILEKLLDFFYKQGVEVILPDAYASIYNTQYFSKEQEKGFPNLKFAVALGGDGTILNLLKEIVSIQVPICGINLGQVGFLADLKLLDLENILRKILAQQYTLEARKMLKIEVSNAGELCWRAHALNDIVLARKHNSQMLRINVDFSDSSNIKYPVDGLIFSTPTGSTAYSLSAGGPIVHPTLDVTLITPICAYAMYTKPLVISTQEKTVVSLASNSGVGSITIDGISYGVIKQQHTIKITASEYQAYFIRVNEANYYPTWQERLRRGEASTNF